MNERSMPVLAVTSGEPAGVGPELCLQLATQPWPGRVVVLADTDLLEARLGALGQTTLLQAYQRDAAPPPGVLEVLDVPLSVASVAGQLDTANARPVLSMLDRAIEGCVSGEFAAMVTAPVYKGIICDAGVPFSGHTDYLAEATATRRVVMMLVGGGLRVALVTTHLPLSAVPGAITPAALAETLAILDHDLRTRFGLAAPRILVAGLNPHAGEGGHMGREEIDVIEPVLDRLRSTGMQLIGPLPADTLFVPHTLERGDAVLAMYHDQGLPVLKHASFGGGVNVTLGLPIIRTSVDHGTALDLAGTGRADPGSLFAAVTLAFEMAAGGGAIMIHQARKRFGQNFLSDPNIIRKIVDTIAPQPGQRMVEIGPGLAAMTDPLLARLGKMDVVEIDRDLIALLKERYSSEQLTIHEGDALKFDFSTLGPDLRIVGNLPYNISTPILFHLADFADQVRDMTFMLQKEVVMRMVADPGTSEFGRLSVMLQYRFRMGRVFDVPPGAFRPAPKVMSSIVRLVPRPTESLEAKDDALLRKIVTAAFGQRRKTLRNTLRDYIDEAGLTALGIDPGQRAERLSVANYVAITNACCAKRTA